MTAYGPLASWYDSLTEDVPYGELADYYEELINKEGKKKSLLDLCCGTGTLTAMLARRGYDVIGVDASPEMLSRAQEKCENAENPLFLCQDAQELDLYGTVEAAICSLDGMNYIPPEDLGEVFARLHLFIEPGGTFAFDMHSPEHLHDLDGGVFLDENDDVFCTWRAEFDEEENALFYGVTIFERDGEKWLRRDEEHYEFAHEVGMVCAQLEENGFVNVRVHTDGVMSEMDRLFITAENTAH